MLQEAEPLFDNGRHGRAVTAWESPVEIAQRHAEVARRALSVRTC